MFWDSRSRNVDMELRCLKFQKSAELIYIEEEAWSRALNLLYFTFYFTLLYFTLLYFTLLYFTLLYFTLLYFTLLYFTRISNLFP